jgi:hypothetical protein
MELSQALAQVSEIREQLARTEVFRGYRSLTVGFSGVVGVAAAVIQAAWLPRATEDVGGYITLWGAAAAVNVAVVGIEMGLRARRARTALARQTTLFAIEQFLPCLAAGALVTVVIATRAIDSSWMLPGLWAVIFSLGVFASCRLLPRLVFWVGLWYLTCGVLTLFWGQGDAALSSWSMAVSFGGGQLLAALVLHLTLERRNGSWE